MKFEYNNKCRIIIQEMIKKTPIDIIGTHQYQMVVIYQLFSNRKIRKHRKISIMKNKNYRLKKTMALRKTYAKKSKTNYRKQWRVFKILVRCCKRPNSNLFFQELQIVWTTRLRCCINSKQKKHIYFQNQNLNNKYNYYNFKYILNL